MESSLHRELKQRYAAVPEHTEVVVDGFRIDAVVRKRLIEIQHSSLVSIRDKVRTLLRQYHVTVVKPIVHRKHLVKWNADGDLLDRRWSPKTGSLLEAFHELVYFTRVFPHRRLRLELPWVDVEEWRGPPRGRARRRRWAKNYQVQDQHLRNIITTITLRRPEDLWKLIETHQQTAAAGAASSDRGLPNPFHSGDLSRVLQVDRWVATRIAYCLRECGAASVVGKQRNAWLYRRSPCAAKPQPSAGRQRAG